MAYKAKKTVGIFRRAEKGFEKGFKLARKLEWKRGTLETSPYATMIDGRQIKYGEFWTEKHAKEFAEKKRKEGYHTRMDKESRMFYGFGSLPRLTKVYTVYFDKGDLFHHHIHIGEHWDFMRRVREPVPRSFVLVGAGEK